MVCRGENVEWVKRIGDGVWSAGTSLLRGSRGLLAECGLSGQVWRVGQENCWRSVVCRGEIAEWVKKIVGGVWSVGAKRASGSRGLLAECGLSGRKCCVGQRNWRRSVVCRGEKGEWVKGIVGRVWSVGAKRASGSRELLAECGLPGQVCCVGQRNWRRRVVCRRKFVAWVKRIVGECGLSGQVCCVGQENCRRVWSVGSSMASGSKELSASVVCRDKYGEWVKGIVGRVWSVGAKRASGSRGLSAGLVCRVKYGEWVKRIVGGVWSVGSSMASESRGLSVGVVCRGENVAWVKGTVARVWSVGVKRASEPKKPHISYASNVANHHSDQNCQNPQNMIHLL